MNQILATSTPTAKKTKTKRSSGPADIRKVVKVFAITMMIFGVFMIGTGSYAIYKDNENKNAEITKPVITESLNEDSTAVILTVTHDKAIDRIEYSWNDGEVQTITGNGRKYIEQEIEIPGGTNNLNVKAVDIQGQEISTDKEYTAEEIINLAISGSKLKITAENETQIAYMTYRWDEEEEQRIENLILLASKTCFNSEMVISWVVSIPMKLPPCSLVTNLIPSSVTEALIYGLVCLIILT